MESERASELVVGKPGDQTFDVADLGDRLHLTLAGVSVEYDYARDIAFFEAAGVLLTTVIAGDQRLLPAVVRRPLRNGDARVSRVQTADGMKT